MNLMKVKINTILFLLAFFTLPVLIVLNFWYPKFMVAGTYVCNEKSDLYGVKKGDTLRLFSDNNIHSDAWGRGTYEIDGTYINFSTEYSGKGCILYREYWVSPPRIRMRVDSGEYFRKID